MQHYYTQDIVCLCAVLSLCQCRDETCIHGQDIIVNVKTIDRLIHVYHETSTIYRPVASLLL